MTFKARCYRFTRTASCHDMRQLAADLERARIGRKALRYMIVNHSHGYRSVYA